MEMKRREFIGTAGAAGAVGLVAPLLPGQALADTAATTPAFVKPNPKPPTPFSTDPVALVNLTDKVKCSRIGFGTGVRGHQRSTQLTRMDRDKALRLLRVGYDKGIRLFDSADLYGTHDLIAEAMVGKPRDSYTVITKVWVLPGASLGDTELERPPATELVPRFLRELRTDYIDLLQIHCILVENWADQWASYMEDLEKLKEQGVIRAHGISAHANSSLISTVGNPWVDAISIRINSEGGSATRMEGTPAEVMDLTRPIHKAGIGTIAMKILGEGATPQFRDDPAVRKRSTDFVVQSGLFDALLIGIEEEEHITEFIENVAGTLKAMEAAQA